jgi:hypothetical protein
MRLPWWLPVPEAQRSHPFLVHVQELTVDGVAQWPFEQVDAHPDGSWAEPPKFPGRFSTGQDRCSKGEPGPVWRYPIFSG